MEIDGVSYVALRKESVDRNRSIPKFLNLFKLSLSARRAWIEITDPPAAPTLAESLSARRAWIEMLYCPYGTTVSRSLSARRAWIEIVYPGTWSGSILSLSARRAWIEMDWASVITAMTSRRSPQGERG